MKFLLQGLSSYMEETALHGFKYLGAKTGLLGKVFWLTVITTSIAFGAWNIKSGITEWEQNPTIKHVEEIYTPIKSVQFPTITLCHGDEFKPDQWALLEALFNFFPFNCEFMANFDCYKETVNFRKEFQPFLKWIFDFVSPEIDGAWNQLVLKTPLFDPVTEQMVNQVAFAMDNNLLNYELLENDVSFYIGYRPMLYQLPYLWTRGLPTNASCSCNETKAMVYKLFIKINAFAMLSTNPPFFGTLLRTVSPYIDWYTFASEDWDTFDYHVFKDSICETMNPIELKIHEILLQLGLKMNLSVSLYDIPNFYKTSKMDVSEQQILFQPLYSYCKNNISFNGYFPDCSSKSNITDFKENTFCFNKEAKNVTGDHLESIIKIMKFAYHMATDKDLFEIYQLLEQMKLPFALLPFDQVPFKKRPHLTYPWTLNEAPRPVEEVDYVLTSKGLCYAWNGEKLTEIFKHNLHLSQFDQEFGPVDNGLRQIKEGNHPKVTFQLDHHRTYLPDRQKLDNQFVIGIKGHNTYFDMNSKTIHIPNGYKTIIKVQPSILLKSDTELEDLDPERRKCRFEQESHLDEQSMFNNYSFAGCKIECLAKIAYERCQCKPWNMIKMDLDAGKSMLCDSFGNSCYFHEMANISNIDLFCSDCLNDCNSLEYLITDHQQPLPVETDCNSWKTGWNQIEKDKLDFKQPLFLLIHENSTGWLISFLSNTYLVFEAEHGFDKKDMCKKIYQHDLAQVEIRMVEQSFITLRQSLKISFLEQLGSIGGTLGLFTGFSFIAVVELIYWIVITAKKAINH